MRKYRQKILAITLCLFVVICFTSWASAVFAGTEVVVTPLVIINEEINTKRINLHIFKIKETYEVTVRRDIVPDWQYRGNQATLTSRLQLSKSRSKINEEKLLPDASFLSSILVLISRAGGYDDIEVAVDNNGMSVFDATMLKKWISNPKQNVFDVKVIMNRNTPYYFKYTMSDQMRDVLLSGPK